MGPITGLETIATSLLLLMIAGAIVVLSITVAFVVPAVSVTRADRLSRRASIPSYYLQPAVAR